MKIDKIELRNYRNFKDYIMPFGAEITIFIGKNGTGKTNLISAIKQSLSFIFSKRKDEIQYEFIASSDQKLKSFSVTDARYGVSEIDADNYDYRYPVQIHSNARVDDIELDWQFYKENASSGLTTNRYKGANIEFWNHYINSNEYPVFAYFSDSYPHIKTYIGKNIQKILDSGNKLPRNIAYYQWDEENNCTEIWVQYFTMQWKNYKYNGDETKKEYIEAIEKKIIDFSSASKLKSNEVLEISSIELEARGKKDVLIFNFKNGERMPFDQLPQGYKRIFSIVFDIANRSYILNSNCEPKGVVIIDEIELHLHPSIAQEILSRLRNAFKYIQFIVSTHSPLVITNFKQDDNNILYKLYKEDNNYKYVAINDIYGVDYNSGLKYYMETPERDSYIQELLNAYQYWCTADNKEMIERLKVKIKEAVGEKSELYINL